MAWTSICIRMDASLQAEFEAVCRKSGLGLEEAFILFAERTVAGQRFPFAVEEDLPNEETLAALAEAKRLKANPELGKRWESVNLMMKDLLSGNWPLEGSFF